MNEPKPIEPISFSKAELHPKKWSPEGQGELWIVNNQDYCMKKLPFKKGGSFSMHYHWNKKEHWYVDKGQLLMKYFDLSCAEPKEMILNEGDVVGIPAGNPHQLFALEDSMILEVSTRHEDTDSYKIGKGDSQK
jgi:mannose-6-phosphate isomerase-like protein (cupin superfamily)